MSNMSDSLLTSMVILDRLSMFHGLRKKYDDDYSAKRHVEEGVGQGGERELIISADCLQQLQQQQTAAAAMFLLNQAAVKQMTRPICYTTSATLLSNSNYLSTIRATIKCLYVILKRLY